MTTRQRGAAQVGVEVDVTALGLTGAARALYLALHSWGRSEEERRELERCAQRFVVTEGAENTAYTHVLTEDARGRLLRLRFRRWAGRKYFLDAAALDKLLGGPGTTEKVLQEARRRADTVDVTALGWARAQRAILRFLARGEPQPLRGALQRVADTFLTHPDEEEAVPRQTAGHLTFTTEAGRRLVRGALRFDVAHGGPGTLAQVLAEAV